ncbi:MAG: tyrosine-type recombinase/integrase [Thermoguttaceae bacterium]
MANLIGKGGRWSLQFRVRPHQERQTVALGAMSEATARGFQERVNALVDAIRADNPPDPSTAKWVAGLSDAHHAKLARVGLVTARDTDLATAVPMLGRFLDEYIANRTSKKPLTIIAYKQTRRFLCEYFGATRPLDKITAGHAEEFREDMLARMAENTARRHCGRSKQFFRVAVKRRLITANPFDDTGPCSIIENRDRDRFVTREEAAKVLEACPDAEWRLLFALSRYGGLRCPSEHLGLRWQDVDWERSKFKVRSPKTERKGKPFRWVPLFPELRPHLEALYFAFLETGELPEHVITRYRDSNVNLRTKLLRIIERAGLEPWPKLFQNLRATRATELVSQGWPEYKVCAWLGHTEAVAKKHYWQVTDDDYQRAAGGGSDGLAALQTALQVSGGNPCKGVKVSLQPVDGNPHDAPGCIASHENAHYYTFLQIAEAGLEPARG